LEAPDTLIDQGKDAKQSTALIQNSLYFPVVIRDLTFSVTGQVVDQNFHPVAGIIVKADNGYSTVTGVDGVYLLGGLKMGNHTITPQNSNRYYFEPTFRSVMVNADIKGVNFSARPSGGEYINNGSFEDNSAWEIGATEIPAVYSTRAHHSGLQAMQAGIFDSGLNKAGFSKFRQTVPIPNKATVANLTFWMYANSTESSSNDYQTVYILDSNGDVLGHVVSNQRRNDGAWVNYQYDLTRFAGKYVTIVFAVYNDGLNGITGMLIDDVSVMVIP
jgi:hypothetical protein